MKNIFNSKKKYNHEAGFSLVEVVVASAIISISLVAIIQITGSALAFSRQANNVYVASTYLEEGAEAMRTIRDNGWTNISSLSSSSTYYLNFNNSTNTWSLSTASSTVGIYTRTISVTPVMRDSNFDITMGSGTTDTNTDKVTVTVSWKESSGTLTRSLSFYLSNIFS